MQNLRKQTLAVVFDLGGVLIDWNPRYLYKKLFGENEQEMEDFLSRICNVEWNAQQDGGRSFAEATAELIADYPEYQEFIKAYDSRWDEMVSGAIQPTVDILEKFHKEGYPLYALSNWSEEKFPPKGHHFPFLEWFEKIIISGKIKLMKPDPQIFHYFLEKIGYPANQCLFIDDAIKNIQTAEQLGFQSIHFQSPEQLSRELQKRGIFS